MPFVMTVMASPLSHYRRVFGQLLRRDELKHTIPAQYEARSSRPRPLARSLCTARSNAASTPRRSGP